MRIYILIISSLFFTIHTLGQSGNNVFFDTDKYELTTNEFDKLVNLYNLSLKYATDIRLTGHTDDDGSESYNLGLSEKRVETVKAVLIDLGCNPLKIRVDYKGESAPVNQNKTEKEKQDNRRVTIHWSMPMPEVEEPVETGDILDLYKQLESDGRKCCIKPDRDTTLYLEKGTVIIIPANTLDARGKGCVTFNVKEVYDYSDMLLENLSTTSNGALLETGGMVYTEAYDSDGNEVGITPGKAITIMIPTDTLREDMQLFYGDRDPHTGEINWEGAVDDLSGFNLNDCYGEVEVEPLCERCKFLFCRFGRIDDAFRGMSNDSIKAANKEFRACQRKHRKKKRSYVPPSDIKSCEEQMLMYGVKDMDALRDTLAKLRDARLEMEYERYGVTTHEAYQDTLQKIRLKQREEQWNNTVERISEGKASKDEFNFYVARTTKLGWINCDAFSNLSDRRKVNMLTTVRFDKSTDCKLIFEERRSILRGSQSGGKYTFFNVPENEKAWLFAVKFDGSQIYMYLEEITISKKAPAVELKPVSMEELKIALKKLDDL